MYNKLKKLLLVAGILISANVFAQNDDFVLAEQYYSKFSFSKAIPLYEKVLAKQKNNMKAKSHLADCYRKNNQYEQAEKWYAEIVADSTAIPLEHIHFANVLVTLNKSDKAKEQLKLYLQKKGGDANAWKQLSMIDSIESLSQDPKLFSVKRLSVNSSEADMFATPYKEGIVFSSSREGAKDKTQDWTAKPYLSLWYSKGKENKFDNPTVFDEAGQSKFNDGPVAFSADGNEMFITRNNEENGKPMRDKNRIVRLKLMSAQMANGKFGEFKEFKYNSKTHSCAHAFLTADGNKLYFASDMPGSKGGMDLWVSSRVNNEWDVPVNLGAEINTEGNELFPYVDSDGKLFFTSNGHGGLGGLDIFSAEAAGGQFNNVKNLGAPFNSSYDDFGYNYDKKNRCGYINSNRASRSDDDDMYSFKRNCVDLDGLVYDKETNEPIKNASVNISDGMLEENVVTDESGKFKSCIQIGKDYDFIASKEGYKNNKQSIKDVNDQPQSVKIPLEKVPVFDLKGRITFAEDKTPVGNQPVKLLNLKTNKQEETTTDADGNYHFNLDAETEYRVMASREHCADNSSMKSTVGLKKSATLVANFEFFCEGDIIRIENIYYDLAKWNIRPDAAKELDKLVDILNRYPKMTIELGSHTDCRASVKYNNDLSQKRAKSAVDYIATKGIDKTRMTAKGYGESKLVNKCECEGNKKVPCTEEEHQHNRRTEFKVLTIK